MIDLLVELSEAVMEWRAAEKRAAETALCPNCGAAKTLAAHDARLHVLALAEQWANEYARVTGARSPLEA